ncbi:MAG: hypothetical protein AAB360_04220 [Patescibacteria group bacterium]
MDLSQPDITGIKWYRNKKFLIAVIITTVIILGAGSFFGVSYVQAGNLVKEGDKLMAAGQYSEAIVKYEKAGRKFKTFRQKVAAQITLATERQKEDVSFKQAQAGYDSGDWQMCVDSLKSIIDGSPKYQPATELAGKCQQKLDEAAKLAVSATTAASDQAQQTSGSTSRRSGSGAGSSSGSTSTSDSGSSDSDSSGPTIGRTENSSSQSSNSDSSSSSSSSSSTSSLPSCSGSAYYTTSPVATADVSSITPLGNLNPTAHTFPTDHIYFFLRQVGGVPVETNLYAPGDITITSITASEHVTDGYTDYGMSFAPCAEMTGTFGHVTSLSQSVLDAFNAASADSDSTYSTGGKTYHNVVKTVSIAVTAGTQIGTTGGRAGQYALDLTGTDTRSTLTFANNDRWHSYSKNIVCPLDYYSSSTKSSLTSLLGYLSTRRTIEPLCGEFEQDEAGTAQGVWFATGASTSSEDPHLALVHDNVEPNYGAFSVGTTLSASGASSGVYFFTPNHSGTINREFSEVGNDGNIYCYEASQEKGGSVSISFILQLTGSTTLKIQKNSDSTCGAGPWSFGATASDFER